MRTNAFKKNLKICQQIKKHKLIDPFCGGATLGFVQTEYFEPVFANDFNSAAPASYQANFDPSGEHSIRGDIIDQLKNSPAIIPLRRIDGGGLRRIARAQKDDHFGVERTSNFIVSADSCSAGKGALFAFIIFITAQHPPLHLRRQFPIDLEIIEPLQIH